MPPPPPHTQFVFQNTKCYYASCKLISVLFIFRRNIKVTHDKHFLRTCRFDQSDPDGLYCPIFTLGQIVDMIETTKEVQWKQDFRNISTKVTA